MPVAVTAALMFILLALTAPSVASQSCMGKAEARQHFGSVRIYLHRPDHCWDTIPTRRYLQTHKVQQAIDPPKRHDAILKMLPDDEPLQTQRVDREAKIEASQLPVVARLADTAQVASPIIERKPESAVTPRGVVLVVIAIVLTLGTIEVLFRCMIYERPHPRKNSPG
ncbi:MAG TPA: hypothetical protein VLM42_20725 [Bryobacteraceae bacterium]|nr:hypothetical protein [Bryobacteraceae bacterium]